MQQYETTIGLEIHVELATKTKLFCGCSTKFGEDANTNVCPVCMGLPGALPVLNRKAVEHAMAVALACNCEINRECYFDRKNYFYPDNPQNYQISQFYHPIGIGGYVEIETEDTGKTIRIHEMHMEEDAAKLLHFDEEKKTVPDYNRSGVPLLEIVTEPDFSTGEEVVAFLEKLRLMIQYLGASDCRMQEGSLRVDVNLSVRKAGQERPGTRTEMKNLNSFRSVLRAVREESRRQIELLKNGGVVLQETRRWNEKTNTSQAMRLKETTAEYRYFREPDLVKVAISEEWILQVQSQKPELREEKIKRYVSEFQLPEYDAGILTSSVQMAQLFEETTKLCNEPKEVSNWLMTEMMRLLRENGQDGEYITMQPKKFASLILMVKQGKINRTVAKCVFEELFLNETDPEAFVTAQGLFLQENETKLREVAEQVCKEFPKSVSDYRGGKEQALGFLIGQTMKATSGKANPGKIREILLGLLRIDDENKA